VSGSRVTEEAEIPSVTAARVHTRRLALVAVCLITTAIFLPLFHRIMPRSYDYYWHIDTAILLVLHRLVVPHPLLEILIAGLYLVGFNEWTAVMLIMTAACVVSAAAIFRALETLVQETALVIGFMAVSLMLVNAPAMFALMDHHLYFGYLPPNTFHNPTVILLKPFAILLHLSVVALLNGRTVSSSRVALLAVLSALAKPSYLICLLPAAVLYGLIRPLSRDLLRTLLLALVIPSVGILGLQYYFAYVLGQPHPAHIVWAPLIVFQHWSSWLLPKFVLSILFPLAVWCIAPREALDDERLKFAWLVFIVGAFYAYGFAETGERMFHGNLWWGAHIALLLVFFESVRFCLAHKFSKGRQLIWVGSYGLHVVAGMLWYSRNMELRFNF